MYLTAWDTSNLRRCCAAIDQHSSFALDFLSLFGNRKLGMWFSTNFVFCKLWQCAFAEFFRQGAVWCEVNLALLSSRCEKPSVLLNERHYNDIILSGSWWETNSRYEWKESYRSCFQGKDLFLWNYEVLLYPFSYFLCTCR